MPSTLRSEVKRGLVSNHKADCTHHLGYGQTLILWMMPRTRDDGLEYYSSILIYIDDLSSAQVDQA
jgi:hypothetical protein